MDIKLVICYNPNINFYFILSKQCIRSQLSTITQKYSLKQSTHMCMSTFKFQPNISSLCELLNCNVLTWQAKECSLICDKMVVDRSGACCKMLIVPMIWINIHNIPYFPLLDQGTSNINFFVKLWRNGSVPMSVISTL